MVKQLLKHEFEQEWRQKSAFGGLMLYAFGAVFICYISLGMQTGTLKPPVWNAIVWIIMLFTAMSAIGRSFNSSARTQLYYYSIVPPSAFLVAKIAYNSLLTLMLGLLTLLLFSWFIGNPVLHLGNYLIVISLGALLLAGTLTLIAGIVSKASANTTLMPVLSFPLVIPQLLMLIKLSKQALDGLETDYMLTGTPPIVGMLIIVIALSYTLFPYLWRS